MFEAGTLAAFGLYLVRSSALILSSPLLGTGTSFSGVKVSLIVSISFLLYSITGEPLAADVPALTYVLFVLREVMIGLFLGFILQMVVMAVRVSSELIGHEMGFTMSSIVDPSTGVNMPLLVQIYEILFLLGLLAMNGHHYVIRALLGSFERAPVGAIAMDKAIPEMALDFFAQMFTAGITFAAPITVMLALVSVLVGLLTRAVPQLNIMEFSFNVRIAVGLLAMLLFAPALAPAMTRLLDMLLDGLNAGLDSIAT
jgi:flagellar biosynthetic protein FliR